MLLPYFLIGPLWAERSPHRYGGPSSKGKMFTPCGQAESDVADESWLYCRKGAILNFSHAFGDVEVTRVESQWSYPVGLIVKDKMTLTIISGSRKLTKGRQVEKAFTLEKLLGLDKNSGSLQPLAIRGADLIS